MGSETNIVFCRKDSIFWRVRLIGGLISTESASNVMYACVRTPRTRNTHTQLWRCLFPFPLHSPLLLPKGRSRGQGRAVFAHTPVLTRISRASAIIVVENRGHHFHLIGESLNLGPGKMATKKVRMSPHLA